MIYGPRHVRAVSAALSLTTAVRLSGDQAGVVLTSVNIPTDAVVQVDGVTQGTYVRNSSTTMTFTLGKAHTRVRGTKAVRWYSPGSGATSLPASFVVTEFFNAEYTANSGVTLGGVGGIQVMSHLDLSGNGYTRTPGLGTGIRLATGVVDGRAGLTCPDSNSTLRNAALGQALVNRAGITLIRVVKSSVASLAGKGVVGLYLMDGGGSSFFFLGGYSNLIATAKWALGASASNARRGSTLFTWTSNEAFIESISTRNGGTATLKKNNTAVAFDVNNGGSAAMGPNSTTLTLGTSYADFYFAMDSGTQHILHEMVKDTDMTAAQVSEACQYLAGLYPSITVAP